eukprot:7261956-Alexandrium_andersonii.AAC.1
MCIRDRQRPARSNLAGAEAVGEDRGNRPQRLCSRTPAEARGLMRLAVQALRYSSSGTRLVGEKDK